MIVIITGISEFAYYISLKKCEYLIISRVIYSCNARTYQHLYHNRASHKIRKSGSHNNIGSLSLTDNGLSLFTESWLQAETTYTGIRLRQHSGRAYSIKDILVGSLMMISLWYIIGIVAICKITFSMMQVAHGWHRACIRHFLRWPKNLHLNRDSSITGGSNSKEHLYCSELENL